MARTTGKSGFKLRSGNSAPFKQLGVTGANPIKPKRQSKTGNIFSDRPGYKEKAAAKREKFGKTVVGKTLKSFGDFLKKGKKKSTKVDTTPKSKDTKADYKPGDFTRKINLEKRLKGDLVLKPESKKLIDKYNKSKTTTKKEVKPKVKKTGTTSYAEYAKKGGDVDAAKKWNMKTYGTHSPTARAKKLGISKSELAKRYKASLKDNTQLGPVKPKKKVEKQLGPVKPKKKRGYDPKTGKIYYGFE